MGKEYFTISREHFTLDEAARIGTIKKSGGYGHGVALAIIRNEKLEYLDAKVNKWTVPNNT